MMVRDFQSVIGKEAKGQIMRAESRLPDLLVACVGGGSNSMGLFFAFLDDPEVKIIGVEAAGKGLNTTEHSASIEKGEDGILHGCLTKIMQSNSGQILPTHSVSAGLDYPGVGPEHSNLHETGRVEYVGVTDEEALEAFHDLSRLEGIVPALESSHALAYVKKIAKTMDRSQIVVVSLSGRGDKDTQIVENA
jgi:tryptophan synthase beta chain